MAVSKPVTRKKSVKKQASKDESPTKPKKLSKAGEWMRAHPKGIEPIYIDWKAVMR